MARRTMLQLTQLFDRLFEKADRTRDLAKAFRYGLSRWLCFGVQILDADKGSMFRAD